MANASAAVSNTQTFTSGDTVTAATLTAASVPQVLLGPTGDPDTGLTAPSADVMGWQAGGAEIFRTSTTQLSMATGIPIGCVADDQALQLWGGIGDGASILLYGPSTAGAADDALFLADTISFLDAAGSATIMKIDTAGVSIGATGTKLKGLWRVTQAISTGSMIAGGGNNTNTTVTGAAAGDAVWVCPVGSPQELLFTGYVSAANTVTITTTNHTAGARTYTNDVVVMVLDLT